MPLLLDDNVGGIKGFYYQLKSVKEEGEKL